MKKSVFKNIFFFAIFFCFTVEAVASQKDELRLDYNSALVLVQKGNYAEALAILETILTHPSISSDRKASFAEIELRALFTFARVYHEMALINLQVEQKNFEGIKRFLKKAIKIYQQILTSPFASKEKFGEIYAGSKNNLEYSKILLFQTKQEQKKEKDSLLKQKDIPSLIAELKKSMLKVVSQIEELEVALANYKTLEQKNKLLTQELKLREDFLILQKKILQPQTPSAP